MDDDEKNEQPKRRRRRKIAGQVARRDDPSAGSGRAQVGRSTQNKRVIMWVMQDMRVNNRVEVAKIIQQMSSIRVERVVATRLNPHKAMQVVEIPDIEENKGATDGTNYTDIRVNNEGAKTPNSGQNEATEKQDQINRKSGGIES